MRCSVVFGVTLRLLVINISSSSPAINTATYYQRCVTACSTVAVVHRRPCLQHLACCIVNTGSRARYRLRIAIYLHLTPSLRGEVPSEYYYAVWHGKTRMAWLPDGEKFLCYVYLFWQNSRTWQTHTHTHTHTHTDRQTPHDGIGRTYA